MKFDYQHLNIAALSALLFMSVYQVFSLLLHGQFIVSFLFLFNSVLGTLALLAVNKQHEASIKLTVSVLLVSCIALFVFMLTLLDTAKSLSLWFCVFIVCSSLLLSPSHALRLNLITISLYWLVTLVLTSKTFHYIDSALTLTLVTTLISIHSQITHDLKNKLALSKKTDPITGCIQPSEFKPELAKVTQLFDRYNTPFSLICIKYESSFSSESELQSWLKELAQLYQSRLRKTDILCRFSSQKFMILLPSTHHKNAETVCSDLKRCAEAYEFSYQKSTQHEAVKAHLTFASETYSESDNLDDWFQALQTK